MRNADENPGPDGIFVETGSYRLVNDGSAWSTVVTSDGALGLPTIDALNRTAEGDYAGLSAYLVLDHEVGMFEGAIIPGSYPEVRSTRDPRPAIVTQPDARGGGEDVRAPNGIWKP